MPEEIPVKTVHLFPVLDEMLIELLQSLTEEEWQAQTVAKLWRVKDVAAHLLDGNIRGLSTSRDGYFGEKPEGIDSYTDLVHYLNGLNLSWTNAAKRISPQVLIGLLQITGSQYTAHLQTLNPFDNAIFPVAWAGQQVSANWFHIAREYTEKFIHQQQIREAVGKQALFTKELFYPFISTLMYALPSTYKNVPAALNSVITIHITTDIGGRWHLVKKENGWALTDEINKIPDAEISIAPQVAWQLFSKSLLPEAAAEKAVIKGNHQLGKQALQMVAVMA